MKQITKLFLAIVIATNTLSCRDKIEETYTVFIPKYMSYNDLRASFKVNNTEPIKQPGKIYFKDDFIFINEYKKGIHVIDNKDPKNPITKAFINIPGNVDMAIKGNILYADSYIDLLSIDISDMNNISKKNTTTDVFPYIIPPCKGMIEKIDKTQGVIIGYDKIEKTEKISSNPHYPYSYFLDYMSNSEKTSGVSGTGIDGTTGTGGSMARFSIYKNLLYVIDNSKLHLFDISDTENTNFVKKIHIGWQIETIFPYNKKLFIGSRSGVFIYDLSTPENPTLISQFRHVTACDPIVVEGNRAYVTLRGGNACGTKQNRLDVLDISNIKNIELEKSYPMKEPYGLGIKNSILFVCDGNAGLKIYKADTFPIQLIKHYKDINAFDVIPLDKVLLMIGKNGFYQYDYSNINNIKILSHIAIQK